MSFQNCKIRGVGADAAEYHAANGDLKRGDPLWTVSSGMLKEFAHCPARWMAGYHPPETDAQEFGSLVDCLYLTPGQFEAKYAIRPDTYRNEKGEEKPWNNNANVCKAWNDDAEADGKLPIKKAELAEAKAAVFRLNADPVLAKFKSESAEQSWLQGEWVDEKTGLVVPVKALVDLTPFDTSEFASCLGDLKTTRSAHPGVWSKFSSQRKYHFQGAFYLDFWNATSGQERDTWCFVLVENFPPFQTGKVMLSQQKLDYGRALYQAFLAKYCQCLKTGVWPDYQTGKNTVQGWSIDAASKWDEAEAMAAMEGDAPEETEPPPIEDDDNTENMN